MNSRKSDEHLFGCDDKGKDREMSCIWNRVIEMNVYGIKPV